MKQKLIILQGPPASGKSTWAKKYQEEHKKECVIVSRDNERNARGVYWVPEQEDAITQIEFSNARIWLSNGYTVISDSTNLNPKTIKKWEDLAKEIGVDVEYKKFMIDIEQAIERDKNEDRTQHVGKKTILGFYERYFPEEYNRYFTDKKIKEQEKYNNTKDKCIIVDLDGTVALHNGREPLHWSKILTDVVDNRMKYLVNVIQKSGVKLIFITGRSEIAREDTEQWLNENCFHDYDLYMRANTDFRHGDDYKLGVYQLYIKDKYNVVSVFEDSIKCTKMWREQGLLVCAVENNDY